jgi:signal transduction histidine kinase
MGFGALVGVTVVTGVVSIAALLVTTISNDRIARQLATELTAIAGMRLDAEHAVSASRGYLLTADRRLWLKFDAATNRLDRMLGELDRTPLSEDAGRFLDEVRQASVTYFAAAAEGMERRGEMPDAASVVTYFDEIVRPARARLTASLDALTAARTRSHEAGLADSRRTAALAGTLLAGTTLASVLLSTGLALMFSRKLTQQFESEHRALDAARHASAARAEILSVVSHDLSSPLSAILMITGVMKAEGDAGRRQLDSIRSAAERMKRLIQDVLTAESLDGRALVKATARHRVDDLFEETLKVFEPAANRKRIRLQVEAADDAHIDADGERILQVLANIVGNALKFTPAGGEVRLAAHVQERLARFVVTDTGPGIPASDLPHLFERRWQARPNVARAEGYGLGLHIAKQIVELHGGRIWAESTPGKGATFAFTIPQPPIVPSDGASSPPANSAMNLRTDGCALRG